MDGGLATFLAVTGLVMVVPGPSVLFAVTHRLQGGPSAGLWAVLGLETGLALHMVAASLGISSVVAASPSLLSALRVLGAGYLAVLGVQLLRGVEAGSRHHARHRADVGGKRVRIFRAGVMVELLNPKSVMYVVALLPQFVDTDARSVAAQSVLLGGCVLGLALLCDGGYAVFAGHVPSWLATSGADERREAAAVLLSRWGRRASGLSFLTLGAVALLG